MVSATILKPCNNALSATQNLGDIIKHMRHKTEGSTIRVSNYTALELYDNGNGAYKYISKSDYAAASKTRTQEVAKQVSPPRSHHGR